MIGFDYGSLWEWEKFDASRLLEVMADFNAPWWVAGGWALDLWMERETRPHQDVDLAILRGDQQKLYRYLLSTDPSKAEAFLLRKEPADTITNVN